MARALTALLLLGAAAFVAVYVGIAVQRMGYPFELEWMEGALVDWVRRILAGQPLYVAPSVEFLPFGYPPLYAWLSAAVATVTGIGFLPLRLVSFAASLGSFVTIYLLVKRETGSRRWSVLAACLFAAAFPISAGWFDIARIDSLGVLLLLVAIYLARFARTMRGAALAGVAFWVAFLAKQIALPAAIPVALFYALFARRLFLPFAITFGLLIAGTTWVMDALHDGWFYYYIFEFHAGRDYDPHLWPVFLRVDVLVLWAAVVFGAVFVGIELKQRETRAVGAYYLLLGGELIAACAYTRSLDLGSGPNVSIPIHAFLAVLFGVGAHAIDVLSRRAEETTHRHWMRPLLIVVCGLQFLWIGYDRHYDPRKYVPTEADRAAGEAVVARLRRIDGDVFVPCHTWLAAQAGKRTWVHAVNIYDQLYQEHRQQRRGKAPEGMPSIQQSVQSAIEEKRFAAIVLDYDWTKETWFEDALEANYELAEHLFAPSDRPDMLFRPITGVPARPDKLYLPRK